MISAEFTPLTWRQRLFHPLTLKSIAAGVAAGLALGAGYWHFVSKPGYDLLQKRFEATIDLAKLYKLQGDYKKAKGTYANDLDSLLALSPDGAALKASLAANVDMTTLTIVGDGKKFKLELNVLDGERTPIKVKGPFPPRVRPTTPASLPLPAPPLNPDGAPLSSGR
jgi:hypothetical protein